MKPSDMGTEREDACCAKSWVTVTSPIGDILLVAAESGLCELQLPGSFKPRADGGTGGAAGRVLERAVAQLSRYFAGTLRQFELPLCAEGTEFQKRVWSALCEIPYGTTESYGSVAARTGNPRAGRAVGMANNRNPIAIIVPCHRVIGSSGALVGYGGGLWMKQWLLGHERSVLERLGSGAA